MSPERFVLLVEDNPDDVTLAELAFREEGFPYRVVVARDGQEALDFLFAEGAHSGRDRADAPALVVLDLKMPRVGGLEVLQKMREDRWLKYVVAVVLTTSDEERDRLDALRLGANLFLKKPMDYDGLRSIVGELKRLLEPAR
jgi:two-component system response regulator